ncbi:hypothetical protein BT63DRAFT_421913 [Microthyrium microscopicum]|uniref:PH domain-containing protein n=1 Tax=Microthyrium microscopicum TaxID=703497 RepID=A0A6A6UQR9_9PEZI|nr:hypothetical protein BT63DRAFT_421913 [Microthyrium microscopicum]
MASHPPIPSSNPPMSRYRSQRNAQKQRPPQVVPPVPDQSVSHHNGAVDRTKSMSRYHRPVRDAPAAPASPQPRNMNPLASPVSSSSTLQSSNRALSLDTKSQRPTVPAQLPSPPPPAIAPPAAFASRYHDRVITPPSVPHTSSNRRPTTANGKIEVKREAHETSERDFARQERILRARQETDRKDRKAAEEMKRADEEKRAAIRADVEKTRQKREYEQEQLRMAAKEEAGLWGAKKKSDHDKRKEQHKIEKLKAQAMAPDDSLTSPLREKFGFFRRRKQEDTSAPLAPLPRPKTSSGEKPTIKPGGGGIVPLSDAPVSAVNHGDRRVRIITQGKSILLPIKPTTTPLQLIRSCVTFFDVNIDPRNSLLMENFSKCGIQRTLRMYEHVRNILNSWDSDDQHTFTLEPYDSTQDNKLYATWAPKSKPSGGSWSIYFSQKRGKWDKRFITMTAEGQLTSSKNESGKDTMSICHLSDFEIYALSREGEKKKIKPSKKYCYAIKSNQKSSMFLGDTGFIHLFCSNEKAIMQNFYDTIYRWRCWYLVNVMGEDGSTPKKMMENPSASTSAPMLASSQSNPGHHRRGSSQASQYVLGSFLNDLDFDPSNYKVREDAKRPKHTRMPSDTPLAAAIAVPTVNGLQSASEHSKALHARQLSIRRAATTAKPPGAYSSHARGASNNSGGASQITPTTSSFNTTPSTNTPSSHSAGLGRTSSVRSTRQSSEQSTSHRHNTSNGGTTQLFPKPLLDLTPKYVEPVQHQRKGRGFKPAALGPGGLIENATGLETLPGAIVVPEARVWRSRADSHAAAPQQTGTPSAGLVRNASVRSTKRGMDGAVGGRGLLGDLGHNAGFTGGGLLADVVPPK